MIETLKFPLLTPEFKDELDSIPSTLTDELPLGVYYNGVMHKKFRLVDTLSVAALSHIHNKTMLQNNPAKWFLNTVSYLIDSIENVPVFSEFQASNFKNVPKICLEMSNLDALYVIIYAHNEFYGSEVLYNEYACPNCKHRDTYPLYVDKFYVDRRDVQLPIEVKLIKPISGFRVQQAGGDIVPPDMVFDRVFLYPITLKTSLKHKDLYRGADGNNEAYNIALRVDTMTLGTADGFVADEKMMFFMRNELWQKLSEKDKLRIRRESEDSFPRIYPIMRADCANCGSRVLVSLNFFSLIPETV